MSNLCVLAILLLVTTMFVPPTAAQSPNHAEIVQKSKSLVPTGPWGAQDEQGMANTLGHGTWMRCAFHMSNPSSKVYEISHLRSETMSSSPFGAPLDYTFAATKGVPFTKHAFNGETVKGETAAQGTQMDAIGHFGVLPEVWQATDALPKELSDKTVYYNGFTQKEVKPTPDSPLLKLGIDKVPPIVTSAVLLDARTHMGGGEALKDGQIITVKDIEEMIKAQGLSWRGILPGDVLYIYTGWSDHWADPDTKKAYYMMGPGLAYDTMQYLEEKKIVLVALDNPFTDPAAEGMIFGKAPPAEGTPPGLPFAIHHYNLTQSGIHQIQNANLAEMAQDKVWTSCTMILPLRIKGGAGSAVRPVTIGVPNQ